MRCAGLGWAAVENRKQETDLSPSFAHMKHAFFGLLLQLDWGNWTAFWPTEAVGSDAKS